MLRWRGADRAAPSGISTKDGPFDVKRRPSKRGRAVFKRYGLPSVLAVAALAFALPAVGDPVAALAERLAALRGEVEGLSADLAEKENELRDQMRSYARQKAELKLELQKEETRLRKTRLAINQKKDLIEAHKKDDQALDPIFEEAVEEVRAYVEGSLPFKRDERLSALKKIEDQHKAGLLTPPRAVSRLWTFLEDEFRLTRESGMYRQTIQLDGEDELADVIRVGMVMLYFKDPDGRVGYADRTDQGWTYKAFEGEDERRRVMALFDSMKKQIRVGFFELPNALPDQALVTKEKEGQ